MGRIVSLKRRIDQTHQHFQLLTQRNRVRWGLLRGNSNHTKIIVSHLFRLKENVHGLFLAFEADTVLSDREAWSFPQRKQIERLDFQVGRMDDGRALDQNKAHFRVRLHGLFQKGPALDKAQLRLEIAAKLHQVCSVGDDFATESLDGVVVKLVVARPRQRLGLALELQEQLRVLGAHADKGTFCRVPLSASRSVRARA